MMPWSGANNYYLLKQLLTFSLSADISLFSAFLIPYSHPPLGLAFPLVYQCSLSYSYLLNVVNNVAMNMECVISLRSCC